MIVSNVDGANILHVTRDEAIADIWCIHGFGESGNSFSPVFNSASLSGYNIYVPDLPGFGASPFQERHSTLQEAADFLVQLIRKLSPDRKIVIVAHSMGAIVGMLAQKILTSEVILFVNIEGFLIENSQRYSSQVRIYDNPDAFKKYILDAVSVVATAGNIGMSGYLKSLARADSRALMSWAVSCYTMASGTKMAELYSTMSCGKIYLSGEASMGKDAEDFLSKNHLEHHKFPGGHWVMLENSDKVFQLVADRFREIYLKQPRAGL